MNKETCEQLLVSYIKQHFIIIIKNDREKYFLTTDMHTNHTKCNENLENLLKMYEFEIRILTNGVFITLSA